MVDCKTVVYSFLTHKQLETNGCIRSTVATDAFILKYLAISAHSAHYFFLYWASFTPKNNIYTKQH